MTNISFPGASGLVLKFRPVPYQIVYAIDIKMVQFKNSKMMGRRRPKCAVLERTPFNYIEISSTYITYFFSKNLRSACKLVGSRWFVWKWITQTKIHCHWSIITTLTFIPAIPWPWNPGIPNRHDKVISHKLIKHIQTWHCCYMILEYFRWHSRLVLLLVGSSHLVSGL